MTEKDTGEAHHKKKDNWRYGRNLYSDIRNLTSRTSQLDIEKSIDILIEKTLLVKKPGQIKQIYTAWDTVSNDNRIKPYLEQKYPEILKRPASSASTDTVNSKNIPAKIRGQAGVVKEVSTKQKKQFNNKWFEVTLNNLSTAGSIMELMNMSDADWDGSCAQLGLEVAHGLFGKKDVNGVGLWDSFKELFKKDEEQENQQKPLTKQSRSEEGTEVVYENVNSEVVMIATSNGTLMGKTVSEAEKSSSSELI
jgi:hypothetical protein